MYNIPLWTSLPNLVHWSKIQRHFKQYCYCSCEAIRYNVQSDGTYIKTLQGPALRTRSWQTRTLRTCQYPFSLLLPKLLLCNDSPFQMQLHYTKSEDAYTFSFFSLISTFLKEIVRKPFTSMTSILASTIFQRTTYTSCSTGQPTDLKCVSQNFCPTLICPLGKAYKKFSA